MQCNLIVMQSIDLKSAFISTCPGNLHINLVCKRLDGLIVLSLIILPFQTTQEHGCLEMRGL